MRGRILALAMLMLASCQGSKSSQGSNGSDPSVSTQAPVFKPIDGYRNIRLGQTFEDTIASVDADLFNPSALKECFHDLALRGCTLHRNSDDTVWEMRGGIPYALVASFNRHDRLTDVGLNYHREGGISGAQCRDILARTIDWVAQDYGPVMVGHLSAPVLPEIGSDRMIHAKTPAGNDFAYLMPDAHGSVSEFIHLRSERVMRKVEKGSTRVMVLNRGIRLFSSYILATDTPICDVDLEFSEPDSVERQIFASD